MNDMGDRVTWRHRSFFKEECAQDLVEYALIVGLIALGLVLAWDHILGSFIASAFLVISQRLQSIFFGVGW